MQLRKLLDSPSGLRFMIDNLCTHSSYSRKILLESSLMYDRVAIEKSYAVLNEFYHVVENEENKNLIQTLQFKLCNLKDINNTIARLATSVVLDDIELYELKSLALLAADIRNILEKLKLDKVVIVPELDEVVAILDPDGLRIATFYIYDSYSSKLAELRNILKKEDQYKEDVYNQIVEIEDEIRADLSEKLKPYSKLISLALDAMAEIDLNIAKSMQMIEMDLCFPNVTCGENVSYEGLFHPEVREILNNENKEYQKVDIEFGLKPLVIMGANMGGKTIVLKTLALCQYLMQLGMGVPALSAQMMIFEDIFCLTTDEQSISKGLSSFAAEMKNIDNVIKTVSQGKKILALIDEPARTTNPTEGTALVSALVNVLQDKKMGLVIVTHYNINTYANKCLRVRGLENGKMNYELVEAKEGEVPHEALNIAESLGIDAIWIDKAKEIINNN